MKQTMDKSTMASLATSWLTPTLLSRLTPLLLGIRGAQEIPTVSKLYSKLLLDLTETKRTLGQSTFGPDVVASDEICNTPMCIASHIVSLAGEAGYKLKTRLGLLATAALIHALSRPDAPLARFDVYPSEWALAYIEKRAAEEA